jgi:hypothetical protein
MPKDPRSAGRRDVFRFFTGLGIGGEHAAINSAVDKLIPGKVRGTVDLMVKATFPTRANA